MDTTLNKYHGSDAASVSDYTPLVRTILGAICVVISEIFLAN